MAPGAGDGPIELRFGRFRVDAQQRALWVDGKPAKLGARAFDILLALAARRDRAVGKHELLDLVWPDLVVEENNLQVHISALRKLFGPDVIATIPGRGYRFAVVLDDEHPSGLSSPSGGDVAASAAAPPIAHSASPTPPSNLPVDQPPLYGREAEVGAVLELLETHRLVTIAGAGGIGKTRVGQAVAHALRERFADGAWLAELAPLADAALVPASVAQALTLQLRGVRPPLDELVDALHTQHLLLVLDNCEHLLDEVGRLAQALLARAPQVRLLVTSQEPLRLPAEQLFRLDTLGVPPSEADAATALGHGAVRLFVERVQAQNPRFTLDDHNAAAVGDIVRRLDGLALAVELAAARVPALGVEGVRERLGERLRMLTAGARIALRRYQTLRAALDWSHGLLDADEQAVLRRLGVFSGGCTIEAAQAVAADERLDEWAVLDIVARLVDKSLVVADGADRPRCRMLESARAYALEKLAAAGETDALARRHAAYYAAQFERLVGDWYHDRLNDDGFLAARATEIDNLRAAIAWALGTSGEPGDTGVALALLAHTAPLSIVLPMHEESERWCRLLAERIGPAPPPERAAWNAYVQGHWQLLRLRRQRGSAGDGAPLPLDPQALGALADPLRQAHTLYFVALHASWVGDLARAREAIAEADRHQSPDWPAWMWMFRVQVTVRMRLLAGDTTSSAAELQRELDRLAAAGDAEGRSTFIVRTDLALDAMVQGEFERARQQLDALVNTGRRQRRDPHRMSVLLVHWVYALAELGRIGEARAAVAEALPFLRRTGLWGVFAPMLALVAAREGDLAAAARLLGAGDAQFARSGLARTLLERRAEEQLRELLAAQPREAVDGWIGEGAVLDEEGFVRVASW